MTADPPDHASRDFASRDCTPGAPLLDPADIAIAARAVPDWTIAGDNRRLSRRFAFRGFDPAFDFVSRIAALAREQDHHPEIGFGWGYAEIALTTHSAGGLTDNDLILAARIDRLAGP